MFKAYLKDISGNIAATFAVCLLMLLSAIGAAVDYNNIFRKKTTYQSLADIAVLAAAGSGEDIEARLQEIATAAVNANNFTGDTLSTELTITNEGRVQVTVGGTYDTIIMSIFGKPHQDINVLAEAAAPGLTPLATNEAVDIALVLDTTGSMSGNKLDSLKTAANALVTQLEGYNNDSLRVSVIPFSEHVNVGLSRRNVSWMDVPANGRKTLPETCKMKKDVISETNCVTTHHARTCYNDGVSYPCTRTSTKCDRTYGPEYEYCRIRTTTTKWHGCVGSRLTPWNERAHSGAAPIPGLMNEKACPKIILPLTNNMKTVHGKINSLKAKDLTYLPAGLIWGWRALQPEAPLVQARTAQAGNKNSILIFMTDGANTVSQNGVLHDGTDINQANRRTENLCVNIKNDRIKIYTVAYDFEGAETLNILRECATKEDMFFLASNAAGLIQAFEDIGADLFELRLTR